MKFFMVLFLGLIPFPFLSTAANITTSHSAKLSKPTVSIVPTNPPEWHPSRYICTTDPYSPLTSDVRKAIDILAAIRPFRQCINQGTFGPLCTILATHGTAGISICGKPGASLDCREVAFFIDTLSSNCRKNYGSMGIRVKGEAVYSWGSLKVYV